MKKTIWGNTIVKNEGRYLWFAINSVVNYLDKILIYDTGSTDDTVKIIHLLQNKYPNKILFQEMGSVDAKGLAKLRQRMLDETKSDWLLILDGDEVWWKKSIEETITKIKQHGEILFALVNPVINLIGDIYHYQDESSGRYKILGQVGHLNIRAVNRKIKGLYIKKEYPLEGFYTQENKLIQDYGNDKLEFIDAPILHFSHLLRSSNSQGDRKSLNRVKKIKYELGLKFPKDFQYPEVFYQPLPPFIVSPWQKMSKRFKFRALLETPLRRIKRKII